MQQIALVDGLDQQFVLGRPRTRARPPGGQAGQLGRTRSPPTVAWRGRLRAGEESDDQPALLLQQLLQACQGAAQRSSLNAAAAASSVSSSCAGPCASDGNQASNCDGGG